jgi:hypothetical protein
MATAPPDGQLLRCWHGRCVSCKAEEARDDEESGPPDSSGILPQGCLLIVAGPWGL